MKSHRWYDNELHDGLTLHVLHVTCLVCVCQIITAKTSHVPDKMQHITKKTLLFLILQLLATQQLHHWCMPLVTPLEYSQYRKARKALTVSVTLCSQKCMARIIIHKQLKVAACVIHFLCELLCILVLQQTWQTQTCVSSHGSKHQLEVCSQDCRGLDHKSMPAVKFVHTDITLTGKKVS